MTTVEDAIKQPYISKYSSIKILFISFILKSNLDLFLLTHIYFLIF